MKIKNHYNIIYLAKSFLEMFSEFLSPSTNKEIFSLTKNFNLPEYILKGIFWLADFLSVFCFLGLLSIINNIFIYIFFNSGISGFILLFIFIVYIRDCIVSCFDNTDKEKEEG